MRDAIIHGQDIIVFKFIQNTVLPLSKKSEFILHQPFGYACVCIQLLQAPGK